MNLTNPKLYRSLINGEELLVYDIAENPFLIAVYYRGKHILRSRDIIGKKIEYLRSFEFEKQPEKGVKNKSQNKQKIVPGYYVTVQFANRNFRKTFYIQRPDIHYECVKTGGAYRNNQYKQILSYDNDFTADAINLKPDELTAKALLGRTVSDTVNLKDGDHFEECEIIKITRRN